MQGLVCVGHHEDGIWLYASSSIARDVLKALVGYQKLNGQEFFARRFDPQRATDFRQQARDGLLDILRYNRQAVGFLLRESAWSGIVRDTLNDFNVRI